MCQLQGLMAHSMLLHILTLKELELLTNGHLTFVLRNYQKELKTAIGEKG